MISMLIWSEFRGYCVHFVRHSDGVGRHSKIPIAS